MSKWHSEAEDQQNRAVDAVFVFLLVAVALRVVMALIICISAF
jgi:hypothetical protein